MIHEIKQLNKYRKIANVSFLVFLFAALNVVPGKSQVIGVEQPSTTPSSENSSTRTGFSEVQYTFNLSLDSLLRMVDKALPIAQRLASSPQPADDANNMNALMDALKMKVNKQAISYNNFPQNDRDKLTQQDFQRFEKSLLNLNDSIELYRTYSADHHDLPKQLKTLPTMFLANTLVFNLFYYSTRNIYGDSNKSYDIMINDMTLMKGTLKITTSYTVESSRKNKSSRNENYESQRAWANIANNDEDPANRMRAVKKLTDQNELAIVAFNEEDRDIRMEAVKRLTNQEELANVAFNEEDAAIRMDAVKRLTNQGELGIVAFNEEDRNIRMEAVKRLTDQEELGNVAFNEEDREIRMEAVKQLTDQYKLSDVAFNEEDPEIRLMVVKKLTNFETLSDLVDNDDDKNVREAAITRMEELEKESKKRQPK